MKFFADTYALMEIVQGNSEYKRFVNDELFTNKVNLYEFLYNLRKKLHGEVAKEFFYQFRDMVLLIEDEDIFDATEIKLEHSKKGLSYADTLGYAMALRRNILFLTGDKEFQNLPGVEFVK